MAVIANGLIAGYLGHLKDLIGAFMNKFELFISSIVAKGLDLPETSKVRISWSNTGADRQIQAQYV
jgi:hypothetical protein